MKVAIVCKFSACNVRYQFDVHQAVLIAALFGDAFVEMGHDSHHRRFLRALRPLFLFDAHYLAGLRRYTIATTIDLSYNKNYVTSLCYG